MIKASESFGKQVFKVAMIGIAVSCLGAAVIAAPLTVTAKNKIAPTSQTTEKKAAFAPLAQGSAFQLGRATDGEAEDCVKITRMTGPDGRVYATRGMVCAE